MTAEEPTRDENEQPPAKPPFQFGLKHLLAAPVWLALLFAAAIPYGAAGVIVFFLLNIFAIGIWRRSGAWIGAGVVLTLVFVWAMSPVVSREASPRARCMNDLAAAA